MCLGTVQARTHVQLALVCQRSTLYAQHKLRLSLQHVYGHTGNLGNECADHAAALGSLGLISSHNLATRWVRHNFDISACCGDCHSISEVLENCVALELKQHHYLRIGVSVVFFIGFFVTLTHASQSLWFALSLFPARSFCSSGGAMESPTSSVSTAVCSGENFAHNMWNPLLELLFHGQISGVYVLFFGSNRLGQDCTILSFCP